MSNPIGWVEIPVGDMSRAITFYNSVFGWNLKSSPFGSGDMAQFPMDPTATGCSGALVYDPNSYTPSEAGTLAYFTCTNCETMDEKAERAGGRIIVPPTPIPPYGTFSVAEDTEGNRIGFHCP